MAPAEPRPELIVIGSINMDLVTRVEQLPRPGQTVYGRDLQQYPGGKGANQAVAAARLGARCTMLGRVGADSFGEQLLESLRAADVETDGVCITRDTSSGLALIGVAASGENAITIIAGANGRLSVDDVREHEQLVAAADALLVQLEVPLATVTHAVQLARHHNVLSVLDPAPAPHGPLPDPLWSVDILTPNLSEAEQLSGRTIHDLDDARSVARELRRRGPRQVVLKLGERGALVCDAQDGCTHVPAPSVDVVDTTAAGDAFTAAMTVALSSGAGLLDAARFACAAGAVAVTRMGAQPSMPTAAEVEALL